ncbi:MAG: hypothetical protein M3524_09740 [Actinomycetota bacterium]|nr:hypothetical protein [Actinomycetota bacterium]
MSAYVNISPVTGYRPTAELRVSFDGPPIPVVMVDGISAVVDLGQMRPVAQLAYLHQLATAAERLARDIVAHHLATPAEPDGPS